MAHGRLWCMMLMFHRSTSSTKYPSARAEPGRGWNNKNQSQHNSDIRADAPPCRYILCNLSPDNSNNMFVWHLLTTVCLCSSIHRPRGRRHVHIRPQGPQLRPLPARVERAEQHSHHAVQVKILPWYNTELSKQNTAMFREMAWGLLHNWQNGS